MSKRKADQGDSRTTSDVAGMTFEESLERIEGIIERIETGEVGLEAALEEYERGVGLIRHCRDVLARAEQRVEDLTRRMQAADKGEADDAPNAEQID